MARNKYPEETVKKILDTSLKLFLEKGYEHTTIQDIVDNLGGLSKGAIYHHFKSKEDIFIAASDYLFSQQDPSDGWGQIRDDSTLTALEKFRKLIMDTLQEPYEAEFRKFGVVQTNTPRFLVGRLQNSVERLPPRYIQPILEQAVAEGSIQTNFPRELAQVLMMLINIWMDAGTFHVSDADYLHKLLFLMELCEKFGLDTEELFNEELTQSIQENIIQGYNTKFQEQNSEE